MKKINSIKKNRKTYRNLWGLFGCFCGSKEEFLATVKETHGDNEHAQNYKKLIDFVYGI